MAGLWQVIWRRWWWRLAIGLLMVPVVLTLVFIVASVLISLLLNELSSLDGMMTPAFLTGAVLIELALSVPLWITMEVGNARRRRPLPIGLTAAWIGIFGAFLMGFIVAASQAGQWLTEALISLAIVIISYVMAIILGWLAISPFVRRWLIAAGRKQDAAEAF